MGGGAGKSISPSADGEPCQGRAPEPAPDRTTDQIGAAMAVNAATPAFIDPPYYGTLQEWIAYRDDLRRWNLPGLKPFIREADANIRRLVRNSEDAKASQANAHADRGVAGALPTLPAARV
jgi:hypothetical protein